MWTNKIVFWLEGFVLVSWCYAICFCPRDLSIRLNDISFLIQSSPRCFNLNPQSQQAGMSYFVPGSAGVSCHHWDVYFNLQPTWPPPPPPSTTPLPLPHNPSQPNYIFWLGSQVPKWQKSGNTKSTGAVRGGDSPGGGDGGYCPVFVSPFVLSSNNYSIDFIVTTNTYLTSIVPEDKYFLWSATFSLRASHN